MSEVIPEDDDRGGDMPLGDDDTDDTDDDDEEGSDE
jgi:hypothetical protein